VKCNVPEQTGHWERIWNDRTASSESSAPIPCVYLPGLGMRQDSKVRYYINKKQYIPSESVLLCHTEIDGIKNFTEQSLYRTGKGTFFIVNECKDCETKVQLLTEDSAFEFMNDHTACIDTGNYDKVFGKPEKG
jgi:hypothetical protein